METHRAKKKIRVSLRKSLDFEVAGACDFDFVKDEDRKRRKLRKCNNIFDKHS